jgi:hypothetical protein
MVGGCDDHDVARQLVKLHQKERDDTFDFASLVDVAPLFADCVKFVEKQDTWRRPDIVKETCEACICLAKIGTYKRIIANGQQGHRDCLGDCLSK